MENSTELSFTRTENEFNATRVRTDDSCVGINLTVSAINTAGIGKSASITSYFREGSVCVANINEIYCITITFCKKICGFKHGLKLNTKNNHQQKVHKVSLKSFIVENFSV